MTQSYFNEDQEAHMEYLASVPRDQRCGSGWHVVTTETCNCGPYLPCMIVDCLRNRHHTSDRFCYEHKIESQSQETKP